MILFVSGLPGSGKSTVAAQAASQLGWPFIEADVFLTEDMKLQIAAGELLSQAQLDTWVLDNLVPELIARGADGDVVSAGMLADARYVEALSAAADVLYVNLVAPYEILAERVSSREHFAGLSMLDACWNLREQLLLPGPTVAADRPLEQVVREVVSLAEARRQHA